MSSYRELLQNYDVESAKIKEQLIFVVDFVLSFDEGKII